MLVSLLEEGNLDTETQTCKRDHHMNTEAETGVTDL